MDDWANKPLPAMLRHVQQRVLHAVERVFAEHGATHTVYLILRALYEDDLDSQRAVCEVVGIRGATLTHHLSAMEERGLVTRERHPRNRRVQHTTVTDEGEALFIELREAVMAFDSSLRDAIGSDAEVEAFVATLLRVANTAQAYQPE